MSLENFNYMPDAKISEAKTGNMGGDKGLSQIELDEKYLAPYYKKKRISHLSDFVPVLGSAKMIIEGIKGEQLGTKEKFSGTKRLMHGIVGGASLALDLTGIGAVASAGGKGLLKAGVHAFEKIATNKIGQNVASKTMDDAAAKAGTNLAESFLRKEEVKSSEVNN